MKRAQPDGCCWSRLWQKFQEIVRQRKWNLSLARLEGWVRCWNARLTDASATKTGGLLSVFLTWLLVARRLALVFGRWSLKTRKTMMSHWHKLEVTGERMKFSVSDLAIFSVILCRISVWAHLSVLCNLFFFSLNIWKAEKERMPPLMRSARQMRFSMYLEGWPGLPHTENVSHLGKHNEVPQTVLSSSPAPNSSWFCRCMWQWSSCAAG